MIFFALFVSRQLCTFWPSGEHGRSGVFSAVFRESLFDVFECVGIAQGGRGGTQSKRS